MLHYVPDGIEDIRRYYGDWEAPTFAEKYIVWQRMPFLMRLSWDLKTKVAGFNVHESIAPAVVDAFKEILEFGGVAFLRDNDYDILGGCYNPRGKRGGTATSTHAWGIAVDYCPNLGPFGKKSRVPMFIVEAFTKRGFVNGGIWVCRTGCTSGVQGY
jgi:hypothetical protein